MQTLSKSRDLTGITSGPLDVEGSSLRAATLVASALRDIDVADIDERRACGLRRLHSIKGVDRRSVLWSIGRLAPDLADWLLACSFDDGSSRLSLDFRIQKLSAIAAVTARPESGSRLEVLIRGALDGGCSRQEIVEVILQVTACSGITGTLIGLRVARRVFAPG